MDWEQAAMVPEDVFQKFAAANMLIPSLPAPLPIAWLKKLGVHDILGTVKVEEWDYIHTAIFIDEVCDCVTNIHSMRTNPLMRQI